jgi:hypothetical protein
VTDHPHLLQTVIDTPDVRGLAEFYRRLLGLRYRPGYEAPDDGTSDDPDWLVLGGGDGVRRLAFQRVDRLERTTWPSPDVPMQMHLDLAVPDVASLERHRARAQELGAQLIRDESDDVEEPLYVFTDPVGHPFCVFVTTRPA